MIDAFHQALVRSPSYAPETRALAAELLRRRGMGCCGMPPRSGMSGLGDAAADLMAQSAAAYNRGDYVTGAQLQQAAAMAGGAAGPQTTFAQDAAAFTSGLTSILNPLATSGIRAYRDFTGQNQPVPQQVVVQDSTPWKALLIGGAALAAVVGIGIAVSSRRGRSAPRRRRNPYHYTRRYSRRVAPARRRLVVYS